MDLGTVIVLLTILLAGAALGVFGMVLLSIKAEDRARRLSPTARTRTGAATRRIVGLHVRTLTDETGHPAERR